MNNKVILEFLTRLQEHNSLEWMQDNKKFYQEAKGEFESLIGEMILRISAFDDSVAWLSPKDLVFRLNRDTRFSKDKSPYNPSFRAHISAAGRLPIPAGYFICIKPGASILGGGCLFYTSGAADERSSVDLAGCTSYEKKKLV